MSDVDIGFGPGNFSGPTSGGGGPSLGQFGGLIGPLTGLWGNQQATGQIQGGINDALSAIMGGYGQAQGAIPGYGQAGINLLGQSLAPWMFSGAAGLQRAGGLLGLPGFERVAFDPSTTPGYQANLQAGVGAIDSSNAAKGLGLSSNNLANLAQFGAGYGRQAFNDHLAQLAGVSGQGLTAANSFGQGANSAMGNIGTNLANLYGNQANSLASLYQQRGNVGGASAANEGNFLGDLISTGLSFLF